MMTRKPQPTLCMPATTSSSRVCRRVSANSAAPNSAAATLPGVTRRRLRSPGWGPPRSSTLTPVIVCRAVPRVNLRFLKPAAAGRRL